MKARTCDLTGIALDWAVGTALKLPAPYWDGLRCASFSTNWAHGGPIIDREGIHLLCDNAQTTWNASAAQVMGGKKLVGWRKLSYGPTALIAAMRCFVSSKLGDEVDVPEELMK